MIQKAANASTEDTWWWWIKGDGCDIVKGIWESTRGFWSGDVYIDLNDKKLQNLQQESKQRLTWIEGIGLHKRNLPNLIKEDLLTAKKYISTDLDFVKKGNCHFCL